MKKCPLVFIVLLALTQAAFSQRKKVVQNEAGLYNLIEQYQVLSKEPSIRQGYYQLRLKYDGRIIVKGYYKNNQKDSVWTYYDYKHRKPSQEGRYRNDKKVGIWNFYDFGGKLVDSYDYDQHRLLQHLLTKMDSAQYLVITGRDTVKMKLTSPPVYLGGAGIMLLRPIQLMRYPKDARENNIQGRVVVAFTIDTNGDMKDLHVEQPCISVT